MNYKGTLNIINACKELGIQKIVMSSSPSTRFDGNDVVGKGVEELSFPKKYTHVSFRQEDLASLFENAPSFPHLSLSLSNKSLIIFFFFFSFPGNVRLTLRLKQWAKEQCPRHAMGRVF